MDAPGATIITTPAAGIPVEVRRKRVKNLNLRVRTDGTVVLSIPLHASMATARAFAARKEPWIARHVDRQAAVEGGREAVPGETARDAWERTHLWGEPLSPAIASDTAAVAALHAREVERVLPQAVEKLESAMGVHANRWSIRRMKTHWGSCTPASGAIHINARLAAYPPACLEFVVAHELVHLMEPSHGQRFHMLLDIYCPRNRELAAALKKMHLQPDRSSRAAGA